MFNAKLIKMFPTMAVTMPMKLDHFRIVSSGLPLPGAEKYPRAIICAATGAAVATSSFELGVYITVVVVVVYISR